jgi:Flp pilus assembly protein TadD
LATLDLDESERAMRAAPRSTFVPSRRAARWHCLLGSATALVLAAVAACAGGEDGLYTPAQLTRGLRAHGVDSNVIVPFAIDDTMRAWLHQQVPRAAPPDKRLDLLLAAIVSPQGLGLQYAPGFTGTAREVFATHKANCLGFTNLFVGMARELDVPAYFLDVGDVESFAKEGDLVIEAGHVTAGVGSGATQRVLDFTVSPIAHYRLISRLADLNAVALYYSNRGAEVLRSGHPDEALHWLQTAVKIDPAFARGWVNLGVALRRSGDMKGAEAAYTKAIELAPTSMAPYTNLAGLLRASGRTAEADRVLASTSHLDGKDPFSYLTLGDLALASGRLDAARRYYERAHSLSKNADTCAALGEIELAAGSRHGAERWLERARKLDPGNERVRKLARRLGGELVG